MRLRVASWFIVGGAGALVAGLLFLSACGRAPLGPTTAKARPATAVQPPPAPVAPTPSPTPLKLPLAAPKIVISKSKRQLELYAGGRVVRTYTVALGLSPSDDKERARDYRSASPTRTQRTPNEACAPA
jgi:hypothetical protein